MPFIRSLVFKYSTYYFKLVAIILSFNKIILSCSCCVEKGLVYIIIIALSNCQPSLYIKCTKLNIYLSCNIYSISNTKYIFFARLYNL